MARAPGSLGDPALIRPGKLESGKSTKIVTDRLSKLHGIKIFAKISCA